MDKNCGNCIHKTYCATFYQMVVCDTHEFDRESLLEYYEKHRRHPFDPKNRETWPPIENEELLIFDGKRHHLCEFMNGTFCDRDGNFHKAIWWSYLPE